MLLALSTSIFLVLASLTGLILAFEPMGDALSPIEKTDLRKVSLASTMAVMDVQYNEVISLEVDKNDFVVASVVNQSGTTVSILEDPLSGKKLGYPKSKAKIFQFTTNLHRSLFLKSIGRFFVGLVSFLLCLIALTGLLLVIKRQGGISKLFSKIQKEGFELYYHVSLGRWMLVPILIVALTGVYLSLEKFSLLPQTKVQHQLPEMIAETMTERKSWELPVFQNTTLSNVRKITYPFSEFPEDYFELALSDKEVLVHQYTGEFLSEEKYPFTTIASYWSMLLHTGQGSFWWSIILVLVCLALLFFIYSGFVLWYKRSKKSKKVVFKTVAKEEADILILVGSETGNTYTFAKILQDALLAAGKSPLVSQLNQYAQYRKVSHAIILTATYGDGEAPTNARNFEKLFQTVQQGQDLQYAVVGFGSLLYPGYCAFAIAVDTLLRTNQKWTETLPLYKINNQDFRAFQDWGSQWSASTGIDVSLKAPPKRKKRFKKSLFQVEQSPSLNLDDTFLLQLNPLKKTAFKSGDLAGFIASDGRERQYSVAKIDGNLVLSVKKHEFGLCSTYLSKLQYKETIPVILRRKPDFYFPKYAPAVVLIANGTGIAPFLGMLAENNGKVPISLFLGLRKAKSYELYKDLIERYPPSHLEIAFSQTTKKQYVQDVLEQKSMWVSQQLENGAVYMICGSLSMQNRVLEVLEESCKKHLQKPLSEFETLDQLKMDCY